MKAERKLTTFEGFVRLIDTIKVMIAHKVLGDTLPVLAHELVFRITRVVGVHWKQMETFLFFFNAWGTVSLLCTFSSIC